MRADVAALAVALARALEAGYGIERPQLEPLVYGVNKTFLVTGDAQWVAKVYDGPSGGLDDILRSHALLACFLDPSGDADVARPIRSRAGRTWSTVEVGGVPRFLALYPLLPGRQPRYDADDAWRVGRGCARLHGGLVPATGDGARRIVALDVVSKAERLLPGTPAFTRDFAQRMMAAIALARSRVEALAQPLHSVALHGDMNNLNCRIDGDVVRFFDFEDCAVGCAAHDLGSWIAAAIGAVADRAECRAAIQGFLAGYQSVTPIGGDAWRALPVLAFIGLLDSMVFVVGLDLIPEFLWPTLERDYTRFADMFLSGAIDTLVAARAGP